MRIFIWRLYINLYHHHRHHHINQHTLKIWLGAQNNCLNEAVLLSTHNICISCEIEIICNCAFLFGYYIQIFIIIIVIIIILEIPVIAQCKRNVLFQTYDGLLLVLLLLFSSKSIHSHCLINENIVITFIVHVVVVVLFSICCWYTLSSI